MIHSDQVYQFISFLGGLPLPSQLFQEMLADLTRYTAQDHACDSLL